MDITADQLPEGARDTGSLAGGYIPWTPKDVFFGLILFLGLIIAVPGVLTTPFVIAYGEESNETFVAALLSGALGSLSLIGVAYWFTIRKYGGGWRMLGLHAPTWPTLGWAGLAFAAALLFGVGYGVAVDAFDIGALQSKCDDQVPREILNNDGLLALATVLFLVVAPIAEEIFFRGFVFPGLARRWGIAAGILLSALLFSSAHISLSLHKTFIPILAIGAILAFTYWRSGNIISTMLAHFAFNSVATIALWVETCPE